MWFACFTLTYSHGKSLHKESHGGQVSANITILGGLINLWFGLAGSMWKNWYGINQKSSRLVPNEMPIC